jgi:carbon storage regulator
VLILTRKKGQSIVIGEDIEIFISEVDGEQVKIGIRAPAEIKIYRQEVLDAIRENNQQSLTTPKDLGELKELMKRQDVSSEKSK